MYLEAWCLNSVNGTVLLWKKSADLPSTVCDKEICVHIVPLVPLQPTLPPPSPQALWVPSILQYGGSSYLSRHEEEDPTGTVHFPCSRMDQRLQRR